jgi:hypothetical protein
MEKDLPELCPLDKQKPPVYKCAACCYLGENKWASIHWCKADRYEKGLPDIQEYPWKKVGRENYNEPL